MTRASRGAVGAVVATLVLAGLLLWLWPAPANRVPESVASTPPIVASERIDPANDGHMITISGNAHVAEPARDPQLGVSADALVLIRAVEMYQWAETCAGATACSYDRQWGATPIASAAFHGPAGHANPPAFPFSGARFPASRIVIGAFTIAPALLADDTRSSLPFAVDPARLPPNLAASFQVRDGILYTDAQIDAPAVGDLRVSYRIIPTGMISVSGIQHGGQLRAPGATASN